MYIKTISTTQQVLLLEQTKQKKTKDMYVYKHNG